jgi:hypothetical protein
MVKKPGKKHVAHADLIKALDIAADTDPSVSDAPCRDIINVTLFGNGEDHLHAHRVYKTLSTVKSPLVPIIIQQIPALSEAERHFEEVKKENDEAKTNKRITRSVFVNAFNHVAQSSAEFRAFARSQQGQAMKGIYAAHDDMATMPALALKDALFAACIYETDGKNFLDSIADEFRKTLIRRIPALDTEEKHAVSVQTHRALEHQKNKDSENKSTAPVKLPRTLH